MTANDILAQVRTETQEKNPNQRWSNDEIILEITQAQELVCKDILWPISFYVVNTEAGVSMYQVPEILEVKQAYLNGQPLEPSDIEIMEGDMIYFFDQTGNGGGPGGFFQPGQPSTLAGGTQAGPLPANPNAPPANGVPTPTGVGYTPQWSGAVAQTYPVTSGQGIDTNIMAPWIPGMRPRYYFDGGILGFTPPPAGVYPVVLRAIMQPPEVTESTDNLVLPSICRRAVTWKVIELLMFANAEQPAGSDQRNYALTQYDKEIAKLLKWRRRFSGGLTKGPQFLTYRNFYCRGNNRSNFAH